MKALSECGLREVCHIFLLAGGRGQKSWHWVVRARASRYPASCCFWIPSFLEEGANWVSLYWWFANSFTSLLLTTTNRGMRHRSGVIARYQSPRKRHSPSSCHYRLKWPWWSTQLPNAGRGWGQNDVWIRRLENTSRGSQIGTCTTTPHSRFYGCIVRIGIGDCCCSVPTILHWNICKNCFSFLF